MAKNKSIPKRRWGRFILFGLPAFFLIIFVSLALYASKTKPAQFTANDNTVKSATFTNLTSKSASRSALIKRPPDKQTTSSAIPVFSGNQIRLPILTYHYISNNPNPSDHARDYLSVGPDKFEEQMKYLHDNNYSTISLDTMYAALKKQVTLPPKSVILSFDDGYMDFYYNAYPILRKYNIHATSFIPTGLMNQGYYLTWSQIREMQSSGLISFQAHGIHHYSSPSLSQTTLEYELRESKNILQSQIGIPVNFMAYPYGTFDDRVIETVKKAGYLGAAATWGNKTQSEGTIYAMPRYKVSGSMSLSTFISLL